MRFKLQLSVVMSSKSKDTIVAVQTECDSIKAYWKGKRSHSRLTWVTQERLCLSSPLCETHLYFVRIDLSLDFKQWTRKQLYGAFLVKHLRHIECVQLCTFHIITEQFFTIFSSEGRPEGPSECEVNNFVKICVAFNRAWVTKPLMTLSPFFNISGWYPQLPCNRTITKHTWLGCFFGRFGWAGNAFGDIFRLHRHMKEKIEVIWTIRFIINIRAEIGCNKTVLCGSISLKMRRNALENHALLKSIFEFLLRLN